jgi:hypothetical protein
METNHKFNALADHLERIAVQIADRKPSRTPDIDARFLVIAADAVRQLGEQMVQIATLGHELKLSSDSAGATPGE